MSATLDAARVAAHLGDAPVIDAPGRVFPVETRYLDKAQRQTIAADAARAVHRALERDRTRAFWSSCRAKPRSAAPSEALDASVLPKGTTVSSALSAPWALPQQDAAIRPAPAGQRKVVLATTIAETSLTIDGIGAVIDTGFKRVPRFDPASGMTALETVRVSLASADQRRGRAGTAWTGRLLPSLARGRDARTGAA